MTEKQNFSPEQWRFMAVLEAMGEPVDIEVIGALAPLLPGPLFHLLNTGRELKWLRQVDESRFGLESDLPDKIRRRLREINNAKRISKLLDHLERENLVDRVSPGARRRLLEAAGRGREAALLDMAAARQAVTDNLLDAAWLHFKRGLSISPSPDDDPTWCSEYLQAVLDFSDLSLNLGQGLADLVPLLEQAQELALAVGDKRSTAMISLHLGQVSYLSDQRSRALVAFSVGLTEIEELGDEDILHRAAPFLGLFNFMQGRFKEGLPHMERAIKAHEERESGSLAGSLAPILMGYTLAYLGEFHRAIGTLDCHWRLAAERAEDGVAATVRAVLGTVLVLIRKYREALYHLEGATKDAEACGNALARYLASGGYLAYYMAQGRPARAREVLESTLAEGAASGLIRQYASPWILEAYFELDRLGFEQLDFSLPMVLERIWDGPNIHLQGVALRLQAQRKILQGGPYEEIRSDLSESKRLLIETGDPVQAAKTTLAMARFRLGGGNAEEGRRLVKEAWRELAGYAEEFFPDDLRSQLDPGIRFTERLDRSQIFIERFLELTETVRPMAEADEVLSRTVIATNRLFGAERGGLFWFTGGKYTREPELRASANLTKHEIQGREFKPGHELILTAFQRNQPMFKRFPAPAINGEGHPARSAMCLPVKVRGRVRAVLYHDNSYLEDGFDFLDFNLLSRLVDQISAYIDRVIEFGRLREQVALLAGGRGEAGEDEREGEILYASPVMVDLVNKVDQAAASDITVLLMGETGVGKELFARRLHNLSPRRRKPFIEVDAAAIPEGLVESELFGHEKGSFTGADRQKRGKFELANKGTLFIDEVGELPPAIQAKFLRALQERKFFRVGGTRSIGSDFRLVAATNRDLEEEAAAGRFRKDLYYRLGVVPLRLPPLRERQEDIVLLAEYFLDRYARKYHQGSLRLAPKARDALKAYHWPGNVRELENVIERSVLMSTGLTLELELPLNSPTQNTDLFDEGITLDELQRRYIEHVLQKTGGKIGGPGGAAEILGMKRTSLYARMRTLKMKR